MTRREALLALVAAPVAAVVGQTSTDSGWVTTPFELPAGWAVPIHPSEAVVSWSDSWSLIDREAGEDITLLVKWTEMLEEP